MVMTRAPELRTLLKRMPRTLRVGAVPGGDVEYTSIQAAINYAVTQTPSAAAPWTVLVYPGVYSEQVTGAAYVALVSVGGRGQTTISYTTTANDDATVYVNNHRFQGFTVTNDGAAGAFRVRCISVAAAGAVVEDCVCTATNSAANGMLLGGTAATATFRNLDLSNTGPIYAAQLGTGTYTFENTRFGGLTTSLAAAAGNTPSFNLYQCDLADSAPLNGGTHVFRRCHLELTSLASTVGTLTAEDCVFVNNLVVSTAGLAHTVTLVNCDMRGNQVQVGATGACTVTLRGVTGISVLQFAGVGGTCTVYDSGMDTLDPDDGTIRIYGGRVRACNALAGAANVVWWQDDEVARVIVNMRIQHAIDAASGGETILIGPGTFTEALVCDSAADVVTLRGMGRDKTIITQAAGNPLTVTDCETVCVENLTLRITAGAGHQGVRVEGGTAAAGASLTNVALDITGTLATTNYGLTCVRTAANCSLNLSRVSITLSNVDAGASSSYALWVNGQGIVVLRECDFSVVDTNGTAIALYEDQTTIESAGCSYSATGTTALVILLTSSAASIIRSHNDAFNAGAISKGALGVMTCKSAPQQYEVWAGMSIGNAITAAAADTPAPAATAPYTVLIHAGVYVEMVICSAYVNLKGITKDVVTIQQVDENVLRLASNTTVENVTIRLTTPTVGRSIIYDAGAALTGIILRNVEIAITTPGAIAGIVACRLSGGTTIGFEQCRCNLGGTGASFFMYVETGASTVRMQDCDLRYANVAAYILLAVSAGTTITVINCSLSGDAIHIRADIGLIRIRNSHYRSVMRLAGGDIIDESPEAKDYAFHVVKTPLETLANLATRTAVGGAVTLGGSGQLRLRINDNAADEAGIENNTDPAGALDSSFAAGRSIRYVRQVSVNAFRATTNMFFGLRATLGGAVPGAAEDHFGFIWNGANFIASSSDGAGVGQTTHLTTPSVATQHQLEAIQLRTQVEFYVDGVLVATHANAAGIPTAGGTLDFQDWEESDGLGGATTSDVTLRNGFIQECPV